MNKRHRGFALFTPERRREIASKGGKSAHASGKAHRFTSEEAKLAGQIGGKSISVNRDHMRRIGSIGGRSRRREQ